MKKYKKQVKDIAGASMLGAGSSIALGAVGGGVAAHGQAGLLGATRVMPAVGTMVGAGMLMRSVNQLGKVAKRKR